MKPLHFSDKETKFEFSELFFSITDTESTILSGNEVFIRISGYAKEETIGKYHNLVRHPEMPRIVFKILWDELKAGKPIAGYVKNRAKNGDFYWVFATIFPLGDRFISIRIKPSSPFFGVIQELYPLLLAAEKEGGMAASGALVPTLLERLGYESYGPLMSEALLQELRSRRALVLGEAQRSEVLDAASPLSLHFHTLHATTRALMHRYDEWFEKIDLFVRTKSMFEEKSLTLRQLAREIVFLSLNASVSSYKVASGGETFGILARDIRANAKENDTLIGCIDTISSEISGVLDAFIFSVSGIRLQSEMLAYFIQELLCIECSNDHRTIEENMQTLIGLVTDYSAKADALQLQINRLIEQAIRHLDMLEQQIMYLGYVQVYGIIEAAGNTHAEVNFEEIFSQLKELIRRTSAELETMQKMGRGFYAENRLLMGRSSEIRNLLEGLHEEFEAIRQLNLRHTGSVKQRTLASYVHIED